jgi:hypothetical protein
VARVGGGGPRFKRLRLKQRKVRLEGKIKDRGTNMTSNEEKGTQRESTKVPQKQFSKRRESRRGSENNPTKQSLRRGREFHSRQHLSHLRAQSVDTQQKSMIYETGRKGKRLGERTRAGTSSIQNTVTENSPHRNTKWK